MFLTLKSKIVHSQSEWVFIANLARKIVKRQYFCQLTLGNQEADGHKVYLKLPFP